MKLIKDVKKMLCKHEYTLRVIEPVWKEKVYKCKKCGSVKSEYYD